MDDEIAVMTAQDAKGLEFDTVVIVEPAELAERLDAADLILLMRREIAAAAVKTRSARKSQERRAVALSAAARDREIGTMPQVRETSAPGTGRDHPIPGFRRGEWIEDVSEDL